MKIDMNIDVHHLARVEGHGNIHINVKNGKLVNATWEVVETPRFFEAILRGKSHDMAPILTSRICGICSIGHTLASLRTVERAMDITIPKTASLLRLLAKHGETLQSHSLHLFFLAAPDFFNVGSVLPLVETHPGVVAIAAKLKGLGNRICDVVAGRTTHPVCLVVGGVSKAPEKKQLEAMKKDIENALSDVLKTAELFKTLIIPDFVRETEFVSLKAEGEYPWIGGNLVSSDGIVKNEDDYLSMTNEYIVDFSTSKFTRLSRKSFAVGPLARFNNNFEYLDKKAQKLALDINFKPVNHNPYMHNIARLIEVYHVMLESIRIIDKLLNRKMNKISTPYKLKAGEGTGAVEVPRGILYHHYKINKKGTVEKANCIIPTTQNHANIHHDLSELVEQEVGRGRDDKEVTKLSEMLVRAYDPCISCSVH